MQKNILKNSFIITEKPIKNNELITTEKIELSGCYFYYAKDTEVTVHELENLKILLIGYALDTENGLHTLKHVLNDLSNLYLQNYDLFLDKVDLLNGRYVVIVDNNNDTEIYNDATALRPVYYWNKTIFSSHESLLKLAVDKVTDIKLTDFGINNGYLDATNTVDVYKFNPNLKFSFKNGGFTRIYPRIEYKVIDKATILKELNKNFEEQVKWLNKSNKKLYFSLTGGYDSRVSLSLVKPLLDKIFFFTYIADLDRVKDRVRKNIYVKDKEIVRNISDNLNLNHHTYSLKDYYPPEEFKESIKKNISSNHSINVSYLMYKEFQENSLHVKSTLYEIAKMPYPSEMDFTTDYDRLFKLSKKWQTINFKKTVKNKEEYFNEFIERSKFKDIQNFNYNLPMMLFWESRMANWHGNITQESDHTSETFIFLNSRYILDLLIRAEFNVRNNKEILIDLVNHNWPILQYFIPNTYRTLKDQAENRSIIELNNLNIELHEITNINTSIQNNKISLRPASNIFLYDDKVSLNIKNTEDIDRLIRIKGNYRHPEKNIYVKLNNVKYSINEIYKGVEFSLSPFSTVSVEYQYTRNFKNESWFDAGKILLEIE